MRPCRFSYGPARPNDWPPATGDSRFVISSRVTCALETRRQEQDRHRGAEWNEKEKA